MKLQENVSLLKDDALTKSVQLQKSLSQNMTFFYHGKSKNDDSRACANIRILHVEDIQYTVRDLRYELEIDEIILGLKRVHHHDMIKIEHILEMIDKINVQE